MCDRQQHTRPKRPRDERLPSLQNSEGRNFKPHQCRSMGLPQKSSSCANQPPHSSNKYFSKDNLDPIDEEQWPEMQDDDNCNPRNPGTLQHNPCHKCFPPPSEEEDPCSEFFEVMRATMEDAVKKSTEKLFETYFPSCVEKIEEVKSQLERNECILSKVYKDLNEKISYYGERNAQQFQYLCVRMEHDRLFYQQQQEHLLKGYTKKDEADEFDKDGGKCSKTQTWECKRKDFSELPLTELRDAEGQPEITENVLQESNVPDVEDAGGALKASKQTMALNKKAESSKKPPNKK